MAIATNAAATSIVIPAFNEGASIAPLVRELRAEASWHEILVVDDGSKDDTGAQATGAGAPRRAPSVQQGQRCGGQDRHPSGHGRVSPDHRRRRTAPSADAVRLVSHLDAYDLVVGARSSETQAGTARRIGNSALNWIASYLTERPIPDLTSGFRAARRDRLLEFLHLLPNGFSTPTTTTLAFIKAGYSVRFEPIEAGRRSGASHIRFASDGVGFFLILLKVITIFSPMRIFLPISGAAFLVGAVYAVWTIPTQSHVTNSSVLLILLSVVIFLVGLVSEQISSMRFEGRQ